LTGFPVQAGKPVFANLSILLWMSIAGGFGKALAVLEGRVRLMVL